MFSVARATLESAIETMKAFSQNGLHQLVQAAELVAKTLAGERKLLVCGNGGSAADAQHLSAELVNRFMMERPPLPCIALTTDTSTLTAIGNDYSFDDIFSKQVKALGIEGDCLLGISTSGRSQNVLRALAAARSRGMSTIGMTGQEPGDMNSLCDVLISAPTGETPRIQEIHELSVHIICELVDLTLFGRSK